MPFKDLAEIITPLVLPIRGKEYTLPIVGIIDGEKLLEFLRGKTKITDPELSHILLGDLEQQLREDNIPAEYIVRVTFTALANFQAGRETAQVMWETGAYPKVTSSETATPTGEASGTRNSASGSGTRNPTKARPGRGRKLSTSAT